MQNIAIQSEIEARALAAAAERNRLLTEGLQALFEGAWVKTLVDRVREERKVRAALRDLRGLDARTLTDIGVSYWDVEAAVRAKLGQQDNTPDQNGLKTAA